MNIDWHFMRHLCGRRKSKNDTLWLRRNAKFHMSHFVHVFSPSGPAPLVSCHPASSNRWNKFIDSNVVWNVSSNTRHYKQPKKDMQNAGEQLSLSIFSVLAGALAHTQTHRLLPSNGIILMLSISVWFNRTLRCTSIGMSCHFCVEDKANEEKKTASDGFNRPLKAVQGLGWFASYVDWINFLFFSYAAVLCFRAGEEKSKQPQVYSTTTSMQNGTHAREIIWKMYCIYENIEFFIINMYLGNVCMCLSSLQQM